MSTLIAVPPHEVLGVSPDASPVQIRKAYRAMARITHPDRGGDPTHFTHVHQAYEQMLSSGGVPHRTAPQPRSAPSTASRYSSRPQTPKKTFPASPAPPPRDPRLNEIMSKFHQGLYYERLRREAEERRQAEKTAFLARFGL